MPVQFITEMDENWNSTGAPHLGVDANLNRFEILLQSVLFSLAVIGNSVVLVVLLGVRSKRKLSRMNLMIVHLSCADLCVAFFNTLPQLAWDVTQRFYGGDVLCRLVKLFQVVAMFSSSYVLVTTAIDRFLAIVYPLSTHYWTKTRMLMLVGVAWGLSIVFSTPQLFIFSYVEVRPGVFDCWANFNPPEAMPWYITYITFGIFILPLVCLIIAYGCICYVVWNSMKFKEKSTNILLDQRSRPGKSTRLSPAMHSTVYQRNGTNRNGRMHARGGLTQAKKRTVKLTLTVIVSYVVCWGPFFIAQMWSAWDVTAPFQGAAFTIILLLPSLNSCTNPWIYLAFSNKLQQILQCKKRSPQSPARGTGSYDPPSARSTSASNTEITRIESTNFL